MFTANEYISTLPTDRQTAVSQLRDILLQHLPAGFTETCDGKFIHYVVPHHLYPAGYHCNPKQPLPFISLASQKNHIALYHMGLYAHKALLDWFTETYARHTKTKPDIGKSCIRFKKPADIPFETIAALAEKLDVTTYISIYESQLKH